MKGEREKERPKSKSSSSRSSFSLDPKTHLLAATAAPDGLAALAGGIAFFLFFDFPLT
jgi:hypothetical protein